MLIFVRLLLVLFALVTSSRFVNASVIDDLFSPFDGVDFSTLFHELKIF